MTRCTPLLGLLLLAACGRAEPTATTAPAPKTRTLTLAAYTTPREVLADRILPAFQASWKASHGEDVTFETSYQGSGAQARAVVGGLEADVVFLSLEPDVEKVVKAGLITHDWKAAPNGGIVSTSLVVIGVRPGNPKGIATWADLAKPGLGVLTPNVKTSGGAMWNVLALATSVSEPGGDDAGTERLLADVLRNVSVMDKSGRDSMISFEKGVGDAVITYENEVVVSRKAGTPLDDVVPPSTVLIENPAAVVDVYADKHGTRDVADAFVAFLAAPEQQRAFADYGLRPVGQPNPEGFPAAGTIVKVADLGGWEAAEGWLFADGALVDRALTASRSQAGR
jgi:sulfate transport system substrate-binding protein